MASDPAVQVSPVKTDVVVKEDKYDETTPLLSLLSSSSATFSTTGQPTNSTFPVTTIASLTAIASPTLDSTITTPVSSISTEIKGMALMAFAAFGYSIMTLLVKVSGSTFPSMQIVFSRSIVQLILGILTCNFYGIPLRAPGHVLKTLTRSLVGALGLGAYFFAIVNMDLSEATILFSMGPAFTTIFAHFMINERASYIDAISSVSFLTGVVLISQPEAIFGAGDEREHKMHPYRSYAIILAVIGAMTSAIAFVLVRKIGSAVHSVTHVTWFGAISSILSGILLFSTQTPKIPQNLREYSLLIGVGLVAFVAQVALNHGLQRVKVGPGVLMRNLDVVFAFFFGILIFGETPNLWDCLGTALILCTAISIGIIKTIMTRRQAALVNDQP